MKRFFGLFLSLIMVMGVFMSVPVTVNAASVDDLTFELNEDGVSYSVTDCDETATGEIVIPDTYNGLPVTGINEYAFFCDALTSVTVGDSISSIGDHAFAWCENLEVINVDENNKNYCSYDGVLFDKDKTFIIQYPAGNRENEFIIPDSIKVIGDCAFYGCESLESITIPDSVISIGESAFNNCSNLTSITIPDSVKVIDDRAFEDCISLETITISDSVEVIGRFVFDGTAYYNNNNNWENNVLYIDNHLIAADFQALSGAYVVKDTTKTIAGAAFSLCWEMTSIIIPYGVTTIGDSAFDNCSNLTSITIPESVIRIEAFAFYDCSNLTSIRIPNSVTSIGDRAFLGCTNLKSITIPNSVTDINYYTFGDCKNLSSITIPSSVTYIGSLAFKDCTSIESVTIPDSVKTIDLGAFAYCRNLTYITIPDSVTSIGAEAFYNCTSLTSIIIPENVINIGDRAFGYFFDFVNMNDLDKKLDGFIIYGTKGTAAEVYANENGFKFVDLNHTHTPSNWIVDKSATVNAPGSQYKECTECGEVLETAVIPQLAPETPDLVSVANTTSGVKFTWSETKGADSYIVYRRAYNTKTKKWGGWTRIADDVTATSYVDKTAKSGYYRYTVRAVNEGGTSGYDANGIKTYFLATPKVTSTANTNSAITVKWGKVTGATGYIVYRKTGNGKWQNIGKITGTSFTDKTAKAGVTYRYTVRAYYGSYLSSFVANGYAVRRLTTPTLKSVTSSKSGVTFNWNKVAGATGYNVYRKTGNGGWQKIATVKGTSTVKYLDKTAKKGVTYKYTVRAYYGTSTSYYNTKGLTIKDKY